MYVQAANKDSTPAPGSESRQVPWPLGTAFCSLSPWRRAWRGGDKPRGGLCTPPRPHPPHHGVPASPLALRLASCSVARVSVLKMFGCCHPTAWGQKSSPAMVTHGARTQPSRTPALMPCRPWPWGEAGTQPPWPAGHSSASGSWAQAAWTRPLPAKARPPASRPLVGAPTDPKSAAGPTRTPRPSATEVRLAQGATARAINNHYFKTLTLSP